MTTCMCSSRADPSVLMWCFFVFFLCPGRIDVCRNTNTFVDTNHDNHLDLNMNAQASGDNTMTKFHDVSCNFFFVT